jgi:hypothetical protein
MEKLHQLSACPHFHRAMYHVISAACNKNCKEARQQVLLLDQL